MSGFVTRGRRERHKGVEIGGRGFARMLGLNIPPSGTGFRRSGLEPLRNQPELSFP